MQQTPGGEGIDLQHCGLREIDLVRDNHQVRCFDGAGFPPRSEIVRKDHVRADGNLLNIFAKFHDHSSTFETRSRGQLRAYRIFSLDLIQVRRIDWRRPHFNDDFVRTRCWPRSLVDSQNFRRISVRIVDDRAYTFAHSMPTAAHPTSSTALSNLQSGARVALLGMVINVVLAAAKITA